LLQGHREQIDLSPTTTLYVRLV